MGVYMREVETNRATTMKQTTNIEAEYDLLIEHMHKRELAPGAVLTMLADISARIISTAGGHDDQLRVLGMYAAQMRQRLNVEVDRLEAEQAVKH